METDTDFPTLMRTYRKGMGWTQEEMAQKWSYSFETISAWERGKRRPGNHEIPRLAKLLGIKAEELAKIITSNRQGRTAVATPSASRSKIQADWQTSFEVWGEVQHIYRTRTEFNHDFSYPRMFEHAHSILATGISLNAIALAYSREALLKAIIEDQCSLQLCFLDPGGKKCAEREQEEGYPEGILSNLTSVNIHLMKVLHDQIKKTHPDYCSHIEIRTYDLTPRFNIYVVDDTLMTVQSYGYGRGEDTPTLVLKRKAKGGLFDYYTSVANHLLEHSRDISATPTTGK
jgi:transcriptional regulator with XRE-family HTH domain